MREQGFEKTVGRGRFSLALVTRAWMEKNTASCADLYSECGGLFCAGFVLPLFEADGIKPYLIGFPSEELLRDFCKAALPINVIVSAVPGEDQSAFEDLVPPLEKHPSILETIRFYEASINKVEAIRARALDFSARKVT